MRDMIKLWVWGVLLLVLLASMCSKKSDDETKRSQITPETNATVLQDTRSLAVKNGILTKPLVVCLTADYYKDMLRKVVLGDDIEAARMLQRGDCLEFKTGLHVSIIEHPEPAIAKIRISDGKGTQTEGYTMYYFVAEE